MVVVPDVDHLLLILLVGGAIGVGLGVGLVAATYGIRRLRAYLREPED